MGVLDAYKRLNDWIEVGIRVVSGALLAVIIVLPFAGTVIRLITGEGYTWLAETPPQLVPWVVFPLIGVMLRHQRHIAVDVLPYLFGTRVLNAIRAIVLLICIAAAVVFCVFGTKTVAFFMQLGQISTTEVEFPLWYLYVSYPVGFALAANFSLEAFLMQIAGRAEARDESLTPVMTE